MEIKRSTYDSETVRELLSQASGKQFTAQDIRGLAKKGRPLNKARVRRGSYSVVTVKHLVDKFTRRRLAAQLGRISPRFLDSSRSRDCPQCRGIAVEWGDRVLCENGHDQSAGLCTCVLGDGPTQDKNGVCGICGKLRRR